MALLNPPEILPPLIRVVLEATAIQERPVDDEKLIELLAPGDGEDSGSIGRVGNPHVRNAHATARMLGLLSEEGGGSVLSARAEEGVVRGSLRKAWPGLLRRAVFEHESAPVAVIDAAGQDTTGAKDLLFALTWFLAQDAFDRPLAYEGSETYRGFDVLQAQHFGQVTTRYPVQNDTRFGGFERWSLHLGFARADEFGARALRPLPLGAVREVVMGFDPRRYDVVDFCRQLGERLPCLWPGALRQQLVEVLGKDPDPDVLAGGVDSSVGLSLSILEVEGILRMESLADATQRMVLGPNSRNPRSVTHVEVLS
jgi:hypothetical protein